MLGGIPCHRFADRVLILVWDVLDALCRPPVPVLGIPVFENWRTFPQVLRDVFLTKLRSDDGSVRQGYARRFIDKIIAAPDSISISGPIKPLALATNGDPRSAGTSGALA
ncbi:MAG: hypothetical protein EON59_01060 [Alphaproteobacteria bacterium]|nr:MAG: hypothetical protein EON59_01060 [Alphaproteobacteria bacterium]